jgi:hypothetical protein
VKYRLEDICGELCLWVRWGKISPAPVRAVNARAAGTWAVHFGPGDCSLGGHGLDEHGPLARLVDCAPVPAARIEEWRA